LDKSFLHDVRNNAAVIITAIKPINLLIYIV
jgi:hypothetical protein